MRKRHISKQAVFLRCGQGPESVNHVMFQCPLARLVWALSTIPAPPEGIMTNSLYSKMFHVLNLEKKYPKDDIQVGLVPWLLWRVWENMNEFMFKGKEY